MPSFTHFNNNINYLQVTKFGMNDKIGPMYIEDEPNYSGDKPFSKLLGNVIDKEVRQIVASAYSNTEDILRNNADKLSTVIKKDIKILTSDNFFFIYNQLAENLLKRETLNYDEVVELIGPPLHEKSRAKIEPVEFEETLKNLSKQLLCWRYILNNKLNYYQVFQTIVFTILSM